MFLSSSAGSFRSCPGPHPPACFRVMTVSGLRAPGKCLCSITREKGTPSSEPSATARPQKIRERMDPFRAGKFRDHTGALQRFSISGLQISAGMPAYLFAQLWQARYVWSGIIPELLLIRMKNARSVLFAGRYKSGFRLHDGCGRPSDHLSPHTTKGCFCCYLYIVPLYPQKCNNKFPPN